MGTIHVSKLYGSMVSLLDKYYSLNPVDDLGSIMGDISTNIFIDGEPADSAVKSDWMKSVNNVVGEDLSQLDSQRGLEVVLDFVKAFQRDFGYEISPVIKDLEMLKSGNNGVYLTLHDWANLLDFQ